MIVICIYAIPILLLTYGLIKLPITKVNQSLNPHRFSIVIPFRNEAKNLNPLLQSISKLNYPEDYFEIILIDDASTDSSIDIIQKWKKFIPNLHILQSIRKSNSPKKDALLLGIKHAKHPWIVTTDADCMVPNKWLYYYNTVIHQKNALLICGPIKLKAKKNILHQYQVLDTLSLIGITMGSFGLEKPLMCNAANMGFHKKTFLNIQKYNTQKTTSGDDIFTLENFTKHFPNQTHYLNNAKALVTTKPENTLKQVIHQRVRWAAKSTQYQNWRTKLLGFIVLLTQLSCITLPFFNINYGLLFWTIKISIDAVLLYICAFKLRQKINPFIFIPMAIVYPFVNGFIGVKALFGGYTWKERHFNR